MDFSSGNSAILEIDDTLEVFHPVISPDGRWVAFCTKPEGVSGKSELYVRRLDVSDTTRMKLDVESAAIPRFRIVDADTEIVFVSSSENNEDESRWKSESTWKVKFSNGSLGSPEKIADGTFNGGLSVDGMLAVTGARLLRAQLAENSNFVYDTVWYNGEQACNVSLNGYTKETLFLDFGSQTGKNFAGESYGVHERLLVLDSIGKLVQAIPAPVGYAFDHTEWVNDSLAVATLTNINGAHKKIVLVNVGDSSVTDVAEGEELYHPDLWTESYSMANESFAVEDSTLNLDSAGIYLDRTYALTAYKMKLFWKFKDSIEIALLGSSRINQGVNPARLSSFALNMGNIPNSTLVSYYLASNYLVKHAPRLKTIVVDIAPDLWTVYDSLYVFSQFDAPGFAYDERHKYWENGVTEEFLTAVENSPVLSEEEYNARIQSRGYTNIQSNGWLPKDDSMATVEIQLDSALSDDSLIYTSEFERLVDLIELAAGKDIDVVGIIFPQAPQYKETGAFGRYGMRRSHAIALIQKIQNLESRYPNFLLMDENKMGDHDYTDDMAYDYDHLGYHGAYVLSNRLDSLLQTLR